MVHKPRILIVDDEEIVRKSLAGWFTQSGYEVEAAPGGKEALKLVAERPFDLYFLDIKMPGMDGLELQRRIRQAQPDATVIILTAYGTVDTAVQALKDGAYDFLSKPFDPEHVEALVRRALERMDLLASRKHLQREVEELTGMGRIVGQSPGIETVRQMITTVGGTDSTVLIRGESGTGKELVARAIHDTSPRRYMPFIVVNCGALPEGVLESELFGHEKGAFTSAAGRHKGRLELADGGTLFLDEIGDISPKTQVDLLRVLEDKQIVRVGGDRPIPVDFRVVAATHRDLEEQVQNGAFRHDLYYRLRVVEIFLPPLRDRLEDLPLLCEHFLDQLAQKLGKPLENLPSATLSILKGYHWPGNVRELRNVLERAAVVAPSALILPEHLPHPLAPAKTQEIAGASLADAEKAHIEKVLAQVDWNISRASRILEIDRATLYNKIKRYGLSRQ
ncbi:sigma-54-dependent Fis family transcriptional regulator [bacterium]|nr:sigma-54-dependent Fis family transcriptional regulator [bacterium]